MRTISISAILLGGIADVALTMLFELPLLLIVISARGVTGAPHDIPRKLARGHGHGPLAWRIALVFPIGPLCALAGGRLAQPPRRRTPAAV